MSSLHQVEALLSRAQCPFLDVEQQRDDILQWLLRSYDPEYYSQCTLEGGSTAEALGKQLRVLGLEQVLTSPNDYVSLIELIYMVEQSKAAGSDADVQAAFARDLEFPGKVSHKVDELFAKHLVLFPDDVLAAADFTEQVDFAALSAELQGISSRIRSKIQSLESSASARREVSPSRKTSAAPDLIKAFKTFGAAIQQFNTAYEQEMRHWKVPKARSNATLGTVCVEARNAQRELEAYLAALGDAKRGFESMQKVSNEMPRLVVGDLVSDEAILQMRAAAEELLMN